MTYHSMKQQTKMHKRHKLTFLETPAFVIYGVYQNIQYFVLSDCSCVKCMNHVLHGCKQKAHVSLINLDISKHIQSLKN